MLYNTTQQENQRLIEERNSLHIDIQDHRMTLSNYEQEINRLNNLLNQSMNAGSMNDQQKTDLQNKIHELEVYLENAMKDRTRVHHELELSQKDNQGLTEQLRKLQAENQQLKSSQNDNKALTEQLRNLQVENQHLKE